MNSSDVLEVAANRLREHLRRLAYWSAGSIVVGAIVMPWNRDFSTMTIGWAVVNLVIVTASWRSKPPTSLPSLREFLAFNLGLNLAYLAVGVALWLAGHPGWGLAISIQSLALEGLDAYLLQRLPKL